MTTPSYRIVPVGPACSSFPVPFSLLTYAGRQFVAYYDEAHRITVAGRSLDSDGWTLAKPEGIWHARWNRSSSVVGVDSHNYLTMAVDSDGYLHLSGNMHNDQLVYFRTTRPLDVTSFVAVEKMVGAQEDRVTYPLFFKGPRREFLFRYRDGESGNGADYYNTYDVKSRTWSRLLQEPLLDGEGQRNGYARLPKLGPDGFWHLIWMWRETPDCSTNNNISYARSPDLVHWQRADGTPLPLPITRGAGVIVDPSPVEGGLNNMSQELGFDRQHRPILTYHRYDAGSRSQAFAARLENGEWRIQPLSKWAFRWDHKGTGSIAAEVVISAATILKSGELAVSYETKEAGAGIWILNQETLEVIETLPPTPPFLPEALTAPRQGIHPAMQVQTALPEPQFSDNKKRYVLRWETLPLNRDQPHGLEPAPTQLEVIEID